jgi:hypothetical protein
VGGGVIMEVVIIVAALCALQALSLLGDVVGVVMAKTRAVVIVTAMVKATVVMAIATASSPHVVLVVGVRVVHSVCVTLH